MKDDTQKRGKPEYADKRRVVVVISNAENEAVRNICARLGFISEKTGQPSISALLRAIALGRVTVQR